MIKYVLYLATLGILLSSCRKEEEGYNYIVVQDLARFQVVVLPAINMALNLQDSLVSGDTMHYVGTVSYVSGDSANPSSPNTELIYRINYPVESVDFDGRKRLGDIYIHFYPGGGEHTMSVGFDSLTTQGYIGDGAINYTHNSGGEYNFSVSDFYLRGEVGETRTTASGVITKQAGSGDLSIHLDKERGTASDDRSFKYLSSGNITWGEACQNFTNGEILVKPKTYSWRSLKYGFGSCGGTARAENGAVIQGFPLL